MIKILEKKIDNNTGFVCCKISILKEEILKAKQILFKQNNLNVHGFRTKTIKPNVLNNLFNNNFLLSESIDFILSNSINEIEKNENLSIISKINIEKIEENTNTNVTLTMNFITKPIITFCNDYKNIANLKLKQSEVTDNDMNDALEKIVNQSSKRIEIKNRKTQNGDIINFDFEGYIDNKKFDGGSSKNYELTIGSNQFIPGFEEQLIGITINDSVDVNVTFPETYHVDEFKNKEAIFKCKINNIYVTEKPIINDEFIKTISNSKFNTVDDFKNDLYKKIFDYKKEENDKNFENELIDKIYENIDSNIQIPETLTNDEINIMIDDFKFKLSKQNMKIEDYFKIMGTNINDFINTFKNDAKKNIKVRFALEKISELENINVSSDEIESFYENIDLKYRLGVEKLKLLIDEKKVILDCKINQTIKFLKQLYVDKSND